MTLNETPIVIRRLSDLYGDKFQALTTEGAKLWQANLAYVPLSIVLESVDRYYAERPYFPPNLKALMDIIGDIELEQARIRADARPQTPDASPTTVLQGVSLQQQGTMFDWAKGHVEILERGLGRPSNYPATAAFCRTLAARHPAMANDWEQAARWWEH